MKKIFLHIILMVITVAVYCQNVYVVTKTTDPDPFTHKFDNIDSLCDPEMYGTLQWAINKVNNNTGDSRIEFNIPGVGPHEIILNYYLPQIKNATIIDGSTQNGYSYGNPQIIINAQYKHKSIFDVYSTNITIKGLKLTSFAQNGILLFDCSNSLIAENIISNYSINSSNTPYTGLFINGCQNVEVYGNNIEVAVDETVDEKTKSYGVYLSKSFNCTIGGTDTNLANTIKNCRNYGVYPRGSQNIKISGNIIYGSEKAIYLDFSNDNIQPPEINEYINGILSGTALPNSTIEVFGSTGAENANEYLASVVADESGDWGVEISTTYEYFSLTQTDINNNTSTLKTHKACSSPFIIVESSGDFFDEVWYWAPPGSNNYVASNRYIVCQDFEPLIIYDEGIKNLLANPNNPPIPIIHWWCGENCDWGNGYFCNNLPLPEEIEDQEGCELHRYFNDPIYGHYIVFDPQEHEPGAYIINAQYTSCELRRILIEVVERPDATITPVDPICLNAYSINLTVASPGGVWSGTGITNSTNGTFNPSVAGVGTHEITYTIDDQYCPSSNSIDIEVVPIPEITIIKEGHCVGQDIVFTCSPQEDDFTYHWFSSTGFIINDPHSPTFTIPNAQPNHAGYYMVTVSDGNGCTNEALIELELYEVQVNITASNNVICNYEPVTLYASEGWDSYIWSTGESTQSIIVSNPDSYSVTVTDDQGCTGSNTIDISSSYVEIKDSLINHTCENENNGSILQATNGNNGPFTFAWTGPNGFTANTENIFNLYAGEYHVTITDAVGCEITATYTVLESLITLTTSNSNPILCINEEEPEVAIISAEATGGFAPYTYSWDNGLGEGNTHTVSPNITTTYSVTATDDIGCTASAEITVTVTELILVIKHPEHEICFGDNTMLDAMGGPGDNLIYQWGPSESLDNPNSQYPNASPEETTLYTVTVTDPVTNCSATGTSLVIVHPLPIITVSAPDVVCAGYEIQLEAFGAVTYHWETSSNTAIISNTEIANPTVIITEPTTFTVSGWSEFYCKGFTEITINVLDNPAPIINGNNIVCLGNDLNLTISNYEENLSYNWEGPNGFTANLANITINNVTNLNQGLYTVTVTHTNGCSASSEIYINVHSFTAYMGSNTPCVGEDLTLFARPAGMVSYHWEGQNSLNETTDVYQLIIPNADLSMAGTYYVTITDQYGCTASAQTEIIIHENPEVNLGDDVLICSSESVGLGQNLTITGGTPDYSYEWEPVDWINNNLIQNPIATPLTTTTYTLTVTDTHGCTGSDAITVVVDQIVGLATSYNDPVCQYTQLQLFAQPDGVEYLWTGPNGFTSNEQNPIVTTSANMSNSGTYTLTATTPNECSSAISIEVEIHVAPAIADQNLTVCEGSTLTLTCGIDGLAEYHWTGPNSFVSNLQNPIVSNNASLDMQGNYILTVADEFGCTASAVSNVEVIPTPQNAEFTLPSCIYIDEVYEFTNLGNNDDSFHYTWDFGDGIISNFTVAEHIFKNEGYHCITLTVENQCGISSYSPPKPVFLYPNKCACTYEYDAVENIEITGDVFWDPTIKTVKKDIIIETNATLTIDNQTVQFGPEGRIIVKQGGGLFITKSSTLRGLEDCKNMWQGIEVWGKYNEDANSEEQGRIIVGYGKNEIKDAHIGILAGARNMDNICYFDLSSAFNAEYSGGLITVINNTENNDNWLKFINNGIGIKLLKKHSDHLSTGAEHGYQRMDFHTKLGEELFDRNYSTIYGYNPYPNIHNPWAGKANSLQRTDVGIWMEHINPYPIYHSNFSNVQHGILAYQKSNFKVIDTDFDSVYYGILTYKSMFNVSKTRFDNDDYGILANDSDFGVVASDFNYSNYGIQSYHSDYDVSQSNFSNSNYGIQANNSYFVIEKVIFTNADYGILANNSNYKVAMSKFTNAIYGIRAYNSHFDVKTSKFNNAKCGILSYDSYYNVLQSSFTNSTFGIRIETINSTLNSGHEISECSFDMIPGQATIRGAAIYIKNGVLDKIHDNVFGTINSNQELNDIAIYTIGASRFSIRENKFSYFKTGVRVYNCAPDGGFVGAGISSTHDNWEGNIFNQCKTNILTRGNNKNLRLRCNMCYNNDNDLYNVNFYSIGYMSNQGSNPPPLPQLPPAMKQRFGAGNEFWGYANHPKKIETLTHSYRYYHHSNGATTPEVESSPLPIFTINISIAKDDNPTACPVLIAIPNQIPFPFPYWPQITYLSEQQDLYVQEYENMQFTLDNGKTNELLNDIAGNMPNGRLKNKLIENSPLSDTVITSLLIEYPLSHGNFKNVMQINMPVSQNVEPYLFERLSTIPTGISRQLTPLQAHNPDVRTLTSIKDDIEFWEMEKQLFTNDLLINLTDTINDNIAVAKELLEYENTLSSKQLLYNTYVQELDSTSASSIFNEITLEYPNNDWISLQEIFKSLEEQEKTFYDMDSIQLSFVRELAYKCPADHASFSAQAVLHYLFEEEVPECEIMTTRKKTSLVKDVVFATPEDEAYIEDNFPDPFTGKTTVNYYLPKEMQGKVIVYDMFGRLVEQFILETGEKSLEMNLEHLVPGVYTYSFVVDDKQIDVKKMIITQ